MVDNMRVTFNTFNYKNLENINRDLNNILDASEKVSKGRNLIDPESDPINYSDAIATQRTIDEAKQFQRNAENAKLWIDNSINEIDGMHSIVSTLRNDKLVQALNVSQDADSRKLIAEEVDTAIDELYSHANAKYNGKYIFAGSNTDSQPFVRSNQVVEVYQNSGNFKLLNSKVSGDLNELEEGTYTMKIEQNGTTVRIRLYDAEGKLVNIDTNGRDDSGNGTNYLAKELVVENKPGNVVDTGVGVKVELPEEFESGEIRFHYTPGYKIQYNGDDRKVSSNIGYNQEITLNTPGSDILLPQEKTAKSSNVITVNGIPADEKAKFLNLDNANVTLGDSIYVKGTDHNGLIVGSARVYAPNNVEYDLSNASVEDRTLTILYGDYTYKITADQKAYSNIDELVFDLNEKLDEKGLSEEIEVRSDGERLLFTTKSAGNAVYLGIKGSKRALLGFNNTLIDSYGKDISYEIGDKNDTSLVIDEPLSITHNIAFEPDETTILNINGNEFNINPDLNSDGKIDEKEVSDSIKDAMDKIDPSLKFRYNVNVNHLRRDNYEVTITLRNINYDRQTHLSVGYVDADGDSDYESKFYRQNNYPLNYNDTLGNFEKFIEELYDDTVNAKLEGGSLVVQDKRGGKSAFSIDLSEGNEGINQNFNPNIMLFGSYTGTSDKTLNINIEDKHLNVTDSNNRYIIKDLDLSNYNGEYIYLDDGISIVLKDTSDTNFSVKLTNGSKLDFGDMTITNSGSGEDLFFTLNNIEDALKYNIVEYGISEPSAWQSETYKSEAKPFLQGEFSGN
ncbi:MAG: hypothetical protein SVN78_09620, partial [Deferribacterota bacterium]|nr:hypothetical protein [Deferribacterota bacterium]